MISLAVDVYKRQGYDHAFNASTVAIAGGLGVIIPPSVPFIVSVSYTHLSVSRKCNDTEGKVVGECGTR